MRAVARRVCGEIAYLSTDEGRRAGSQCEVLGVCGWGGFDMCVSELFSTCRPSNSRHHAPFSSVAFLLSCLRAARSTSTTTRSSLRAGRRAP